VFAKFKKYTVVTTRPPPAARRRPRVSTFVTLFLVPGLYGALKRGGV
jgi:hypothetical protein